MRTRHIIWFDGIIKYTFMTMYIIEIIKELLLWRRISTKNHSFHVIQFLATNWTIETSIFVLFKFNRDHFNLSCFFFSRFRIWVLIVIIISLSSMCTSELNASFNMVPAILGLMESKKKSIFTIHIIRTKDWGLETGDWWPFLFIHRKWIEPEMKYVEEEIKRKNQDRNR